MTFSPIDFNTIRTNISTLLDAVLTEAVYLTEPDALSFPRVIVGNVFMSESIRAQDNFPVSVLDIPLEITSCVAGQTRTAARTECWTTLGKVQDVIRENPTFNSYAGVTLSIVGDLSINEEGYIFWTVTQNWQIHYWVPKT